MKTCYFAYGSNMDAAQMALRCPGALALGSGVLADYQFLINQRGYATLCAEEGAETPGVVWLLGKRHIKVLDRYEGHESGLYDKCYRHVLLEGGQNRSCLVYIDHRNQRRGLPREDYLEWIMNAAETHDLPKSHIALIQSFSDAPH